MYRVALTGGIASGKSTVANRFAQHGIPIIDTDLIAREIVQPGSPILQQICKQLGDDLINAKGELDRPLLRQRIFQSPEIRKQLEHLMHPAIWQCALEKISLLKANANAPYLILVVPLLVETGNQQRADRILTVELDRDLQLARLMQRDAISEAEATAILTAQASSTDRIQSAHDVLYNRGSLEDLLQQVDQLHQQYLEYSK